MAKQGQLELAIRIAAKVDKSLSGALNDVQRQVSGLSKNMSALGTAGLVAMSALAVGTTKIVRKCTNEAVKYENELADSLKYVNGIMDENGKISNKTAENGKTFAENYETLYKSILNLSTTVPLTRDYIADLTAIAGQTGKTLEEMFTLDEKGNVVGGLIKDAAVMAAAWDMPAKEVMDFASKQQNALGMSRDEIWSLSNLINYLGANSATTAAEIANTISAAGSLAQLGGIDPKATAVLADVMLATGVEADRAATSIKRMALNLTKGVNMSKKQKAILAEMDMTAEQLQKNIKTDGAKTLMQLFEGIKNLPGEKQLDAVGQLFGVWASEGGAKIVNNLDLYTEMLDKIKDESAYMNSMQREFDIKSATPESIKMMRENAANQLMVNMGRSFVPMVTQTDEALRQLFLHLNDNMPELTQLAESLGTLASRGVEKLGSAMDTALPYIQKGLDYLINNGEQVVRVLGGMAAAFVGMKFAPAAEGLFSGGGRALFGSGGKGGLWGGLKSLYGAGTSLPGKVMNGRNALQNGALLGQQLAGNKGIGILAVLQNWGGLFSGKKKTAQEASRSVFSAVSNAAQNGLTAGGVLKNAITNSSIGQYASSVFGGLKGQRAAGKRFAGSLGAGMKTLLNALPGGKGGGLMGTTGLASLTDIAFGTPLSGGEAIKNILGSGWGLAKSTGALGKSIYGPIAGGLGSLLSGALPVVGVISGVIAAVSILTDKFGGLDKIVQRVFGDTGLEKFTTFKDALLGLFEDGGVAKALQPLQEGITSLFGADAGAAFGGITTTLQSVMGVIGQLVTFSQTTVRPIIESIFSFITQTVVPVILQTITAAAPSIASIISGVGSVVMTVAQIIGEAIQFLMPIIQTVITVLLHIGQVVVPTVLAAIGVFAEGISSAITGVKTIFEGVINFITGVFSGNWRMAWEGVKSIFVGIFDTLGALFKTSINAVIALINKAIAGINSLGITIPDWVPLLGGKSFSINIPEIPMLARGGFTNGASIAGEAGTEAVISFQRAARRDNLDIWAKAGQMLGVKPVELAEIDGGSPGGGGGMTFAPVINIQGNADRGMVEEALAEAQARFEAWYLQMQRRQARTAY